MRVTDLFESLPFPPGSDTPPNIIDLRDPVKGRGGRRVRYANNHRDEKGKTSYLTKTPTTMVALTKTGAIVFYYGDHNTRSWREVLELVGNEIDKSLQNDLFDISVHGTGFLINRDRETKQWAGDRNRYSLDLVPVCQALLDRGLARPNMPIWIGNWAARKGEHVGTISELIRGAESRRQITLFHGTDNYRLAEIMKVGLRPMAFGDRVWNKTGLDKVRPAHREEAIYLTASRPQAEYYAKKAVSIDRKRFGPANTRLMNKAVGDATTLRDHMARQLARYDRMSPEQIAAEEQHRQQYQPHLPSIESNRQWFPKRMVELEEIIAKGSSILNPDFDGKFEPVLLQITLYAKEFEKLMADDDHLRVNPDAKAEDWQHSLSHFGQVAFRGTIPPSRIKVIATGADAAQKSR